MIRSRCISMKTEQILRMMADGKTYAEMLRSELKVTRQDIADAAAEILQVLGPRLEPRTKLEAIRQTVPRVYAKWSEEEDRRLIAMFRRKLLVGEIAAKLQRSEMGIKARLVKLGLMSPEQVPELKKLQERRRRRWL
ncbi:MAG: hypothetical protein ABIK43_06735 [candidate division WOR-3 bacterium]